jgi:hypothetical protein
MSTSVTTLLAFESLVDLVDKVAMKWAEKSRRSCPKRLDVPEAEVAVSGSRNVRGVCKIIA